MLKKCIVIFTILCMLLTFTACKGKGDDEGYLSPTEPSDTDVTGNETEDVPEDSTNESVTPSTPNKQEAIDNAEQKGEGAGSYIESESGNILQTGDHKTDGDYAIMGSVTNDNGFIPDYSGEGYAQIIENKFVKTSEQNTSTFAADVDTASYANLRRYINSGHTVVNKDAVRIEEMINYFNYDYGTPKDDEPFSVATEIFDCPWNSNKLVRIGLATKQPEYDKMPASNLVFLIDVSGSMSSANKLPLVKQAFSMLTENLGKNDKISIVTYASSDKIVIEGYGSDKQLEIQNAIENLEAGGGTHGSKGIITAYEIAQKYFIKGGNNRVILATDGDLNIGVTDTNELTDLIIQKKQSGIYLSVMGFGTGNLMDETLEAIADNGNGNYSYIDSTLEARKVLIEEMGGTLFTVAKDVKLQVEFNSEAVSEYRLIGYENRVMANEHFNDDTKDGGEIGAGHRVTVLYEIKTTDKKTDTWFNLGIRHKKPDGDKSELLTYTAGTKNYTKTPSEDSVFASSVAQFGMLLRGSQYVSGNYSDILKRIENLSCVKTDPYKKELLGFVQKYAK